MPTTKAKKTKVFELQYLGVLSDHTGMLIIGEPGAIATLLELSTNLKSVTPARGYDNCLAMATRVDFPDSVMTYRGRDLDYNLARQLAKRSISCALGQMKEYDSDKFTVDVRVDPTKRLTDGQSSEQLPEDVEVSF